jgi:hypothetical protein
MKCPIILFCLLVLIAITTADDDPGRKLRLITCLNREIDKANSEFKLNDDELQNFEDILDREVMKDTLAVHSLGEGENSAEEIKKSEYLALPNVSNNTVDKMLKKLGKDKSTLS